MKTSYVVGAGQEETSSANTPADERGRTEKWVANQPIAHGASHSTPRPIPTTRRQWSVHPETEPNYQGSPSEESYCSGPGSDYSVSPSADNHRPRSGSDYSASPSADNRRPRSGSDYSASPSADNHRPRSGRVYLAPPSAYSYRPGSGTNYSVSPTISGNGTPSGSTYNDRVRNSNRQDLAE